MDKRPRITLRGFQPGRRGVASVLGELETAVMEILWNDPSQTVNDVERRLRGQRAVAHTTVLTTLDRLHRKGLLERSKQGKAFMYVPRLSRQEFERGMAEEVLAALLRQFRSPALSAFMDLVGEDPAALDRLQRMITERRLQLDAGRVEGRPPT